MEEHLGFNRGSNLHWNGVEQEVKIVKELKIVEEVKTVKEAKRSVDLWRFACGNVWCWNEFEVSFGGTFISS